LLMTTPHILSGPGHDLVSGTRHLSFQTGRFTVAAVSRIEQDGMALFVVPLVHGVAEERCRAFATSS
uniref:hypothetical protein n=1 Tax=Frankia sp. AvcI1 TaxID=573496 RepID=UPI002118AEDE